MTVLSNSRSLIKHLLDLIDIQMLKRITRFRVHCICFDTLLFVFHAGFKKSNFVQIYFMYLFMYNCVYVYEWLNLFIGFSLSDW